MTPPGEKRNPPQRSYTQKEPRKRRKRQPPADAAWCLKNLDTLSLESFALHFGLTQKLKTLTRYRNILNKYISDENTKKNLLDNLKMWSDTTNSVAFWQERARTATVVQSRADCSSFVNNLIMEVTPTTEDDVDLSVSATEQEIESEAFETSSSSTTTPSIINDESSPALDRTVLFFTNMENSTISNFSSDNPNISYFKSAPLSKWGFDFYKTYLLKSSITAPRPCTIYGRYRLCLRNLLQLKDLTEEQRLVVLDLQKNLNNPTTQEENQTSTTNYYYYGPIGSIGVQGNVSLTPQKRIHQEEDDTESEHEPASDLTQTTDESYNDEGAKSTYGEVFTRRLYIMTFSELITHNFEDGTIYSMDNSLSLDERMALSYINYTDSSPEDISLKPAVFSDNTYNEMRKWRRMILTKDEYSPTLSTIPFERNLQVFLLNVKETLERPVLSNTHQSEIDFTIQNVSTLLNFIFNARGQLHVCWERALDTKKDQEEKTIRTDFLIYSNNLVIGCGEVKLECDDKLKEEDRARLGETMKRQLHKRIYSAKGTKEFMTFGIFIVNLKLELYCCRFSDKKEYELVLLKTITLPTVNNTYAYVEESLEVLFNFKKMMEDSLPHPSDMELRNIYEDYCEYLKPTVSFLKLSN